jgi:hypothetical protein
MSGRIRGSIRQSIVLSAHAFAAAREWKVRAD